MCDPIWQVTLRSCEMEFHLCSISFLPLTPLPLHFTRKYVLFCWLEFRTGRVGSPPVISTGKVRHTRKLTTTRTEHVNPCKQDSTPNSDRSQNNHEKRVRPALTANGQSSAAACKRVARPLVKFSAASAMHNKYKCPIDQELTGAAA